MSLLFSPLKMGDITLPNRIIMSPLTRSRAGKDRIPNHLMAEYYAQRASAGLIVTEATSICPMGVGYADTPGIWSEEQVAGWRLVTEAVHKKDGRIFLQLWHVGRVSAPCFLDGQTPVAPSPIAPSGFVSLVQPKQPYVTPRALELNEITQLIADYRLAAEHAKQAGFDGVEIHGANGYLLDQFLQDKTNQRTDQYGGSLENRARLILEVTDAVISVWGSGKVGVHLAPRGDAHDMGDTHPLETFSYVVTELGKRKIAFLFCRDRYDDLYMGLNLKKAFGGVYIANQGVSKIDAEKLIQSGDADAVAWGVLFIANPDLPKRFFLDAPLNTPDPQTFYSPGPKGYTDYPFLENTKS